MRGGAGASRPAVARLPWVLVALTIAAPLGCAPERADAVNARSEVGAADAEAPAPASDPSGALLL
ncbi:MAG: hypothetical protein AMS19_05650 [Gemmatimonas sp. SG8_23]|nr:MAG: hypothetical protein AMS19_05650 [Gemmatimonas sp. SG8_23]